MIDRPNQPLALGSVFVSGLLFGLGLTVSAMVNPAKVVGFLDLFGNWDPSLALVMGGGLAVTLPAFRLILKRDRPLLESRFFLPTRQDVDRRLIGGAILFGVGWGLAGLCPGPALTSLITLNSSVWLFVLAMVGGMVFHRKVLEN
ncbi:MAG: YeeE/YedE family protein [Gammaproteobacteria bacterium]|nr:YeeE/YedE family protein [Gammaproteobacteria bacterium]